MRKSLFTFSLFLGSVVAFAQANLNIFTPKVAKYFQK